MAKAAWLTLEPLSGKGNATVQNTGTVHTGRVQRTTTVTGVATGVDGVKSYNVIQEAKPAFLSVDTNIFNISNEYEVVTITGKSNATSISFSSLTGTLIIKPPASIIVNGSTEVYAGDTIPNDPGATQEYTWSAELVVPMNNGAKRTGVFNVIAADCSPVEITVIQDALSCTVAVSIDPVDRGSVSGGGVYSFGETTTVSCVLQNPEDKFGGWFEDGHIVSDSADFTFVCKGDRNLVAKIYYLTISTNSMDFDNGGGLKPLTITTNTDWEIS